MAAFPRICPSISVRRTLRGFTSKLFSFDANAIIVYTIIMIWDETKRLLNLEKHHLDFVDAGLVLSNRYRLEFESVRNGEVRRQTFAYVTEVLTVLTVIWLPGKKQRIISFRRANRHEREAYHAWLEKEFTN
ncbi:MAG: BrnT family toxin [Desulfuromonadaceae bacterium]